MEPTSGVGKARPGAVEVPGGYTIVQPAKLATAQADVEHKLPKVVRIDEGRYALVSVGGKDIPGHLTPDITIDPTPTILPDQPTKGAA